MAYRHIWKVGDVAAGLLCYPRYRPFVFCTGAYPGLPKLKRMPDKQENVMASHSRLLPSNSPDHFSLCVSITVKAFAGLFIFIPFSFEHLKTASLNLLRCSFHRSHAPRQQISLLKRAATWFEAVQWARRGITVAGEVLVEESTFLLTLGHVGTAPGPEEEAGVPKKICCNLAAASLLITRLLNVHKRQTNTKNILITNTIRGDKANRQRDIYGLCFKCRWGYLNCVCIPPSMAIKKNIFYTTETCSTSRRLAEGETINRDYVSCHAK